MQKGDAMKLSAEQMAERRQIMLQTAFRLFAERNIDSVSMEDVAAETDYGIRSFYRYFKDKDTLVIETATWAFQTFTAENSKRNPEQTGGTAADVYAFFPIMLAIVTRYAVGLVYRSESDPERELLFQRDLLLQRFTTDTARSSE